MKDEMDRRVFTVPEAGARLGLGRNASYGAAKRGDIPVIRLGKLLRVPKMAIERLLDASTQIAPSSRPVPLTTSRISEEAS
jgi:excisionase family DNA binding protein